MNRIFSAVMFSFLAPAALAQAPARVMNYELEGKNIFDIRGFLPGSAAEFYSHRGGGKQLLLVAVNEQGQLLLPAEKSFTPAFVLNAKNLLSGKAGSRKVYFLERREFILGDIMVCESNKSLELHYTAAVGEPGTYHFDLMRSVDEGPFQPIPLPEVNHATVQEYIFREPEAPRGRLQYKIRVTAKQGDFEVYSGIQSARVADLVLYPNPCTDRLYVNGESSFDRYTIYDMRGLVMVQGPFRGLAEAGIDVKDFAPGTYVLEAATPGTSGSTRITFIKR